MRLVSTAPQSLIALPKEIEASRLREHTSFIFISDEVTAAKIKGKLTAIAPTSEAVISDTVLTSIAKGPLAVNVDKDGQLIANSPVFKVRGRIEAEAELIRPHRGIAKIEARPQSPASALWRSVIRVLIRETDF